MNEKKLQFEFDVPIFTAISEPFSPEGFATKEEWFAKVQEMWDKTLKELEECKEFEECGLPLPGITPEMTHSYPPNNRRAIARFSVAFAIFALIAALRRVL